MATHTVTEDGFVPDADGFEINGPRTILIGAPDGATVTLQIYNDGAWINVEDGEFTAAAAKNLDVYGKQRIRAQVASFNSEFKVTL